MTRLIYPDVHECRALVVDGNATSRSILVNMLRQMGVGHVYQCGRVLEARRYLEDRVFDIVLCDYHFENSTMSGQELLDDLRRAQLLPYSTVFVMVTGEASYTSVAEAAEAALDSYLLKPHTATALEQRLLQARHRKKVLKDIFEAIEAGELELAAKHCQERFERREQYWLYAARIGAELFIRQGKHDNARTMYESVQAHQALPWAKLGIARVEVETGQLPQARRTLESLISEQPSYADAYDVMSRVQIEQGDLGAAMETYRTAASITPASIGRLQKLGMLAFYQGDAAQAMQSLERSVRIGLSSKMFDCQTLVLLAQLYFDALDTKGFMHNHESLVKANERRAGSVRLQRFLMLSNVLAAILERRTESAMEHLRALAAAIRADDFDFEAAINMMSLMPRLKKADIAVAEASGWVRDLAHRFCASNAATELLVLATGDAEDYAAIVRESHTAIAGMAEQAMNHSVAGAPAEAVKALMVRGTETLNAKLIDLAGLVLQHHGSKIANRDELGPVISSMRTRYCTKGAQVAIGGQLGRMAGGLNLRA